MEVLGFDILSLFSISNILAILMGTLVGMLIGAMPGLGGPVAVVLLLPLTYAMTPLASILLLLAAYQAAEYGGSISSIILGIPGSPSAVATTLDGNPLAKQSSPGKALLYSLIASTIGGLVGGLLLVFLSIPISSFAIRFSEPEYFLLGILGLIAVSVISSKDVTKSLISVVLGLIAGTIGMDALSGSPRFTFNRPELMNGLSMTTLMVSVFAFTEIFSMISDELNKKYDVSAKKIRSKLSLKEFRGVIKPIGIGSIIGSFVGVMPGLGASASSWFAYSAAKKMSKSPETFGKGNPEGIAAPEAANNATVGGALVPLLALGIPGSPSIAIVMGAFIIHGIQPGPSVFTNNADLINGIFYGFLLTTLAMFIIGRFLSPMYAKVLTVPVHILIPSILFLSIVGIYASVIMYFDLWFALIFGFACFFLRKLEYSLPSFALAFVLCPIIEISLRRALILSQGSYSVFIERPLSLALIIIILVMVIGNIFGRFRKKKDAGPPAASI
ncbi:tripartite tricarboxylate transporter permease [Robertmurraya massiliosenegalensis]|uniref:tripartite tricarboxylate transporter permease n=1 Tax=Robertmurraya TaxID=2837507 RepID=UPI0039A481C4